MKDSGVEWIGEIPKEWETRRLKVALAREKKRVDKYSGEDILSLTKGGVVVRDLVNPKGKMPATFDGYQLISKGNIVTCLFDIDVTPRCVGIANNDGLTSPAYTQYKVINDFEMDFIYYYLLMLDNDKVLVPITKSLRNTIKSEDFLNLEFSFPDNISQKKISAHITTSISKIHQLIDETQQSIKELKKYKQSLITETVTKGLDKNVEMKDSGFEVIGNINSSYKVIPLGYLGKFQNGISKSAEYFGEGFPFVSYGDIYKNRVLPSQVIGLVKSTEEDQKNYSVEKGDILFTRTSETIEEVGMTAVCLNSIPQATFAGFAIRFRPNSKAVLLTEYARYYFDASFLRDFFAKEMNLVTRASLSQPLLKKVPVIIPSMENQKQVIDYLDKKISEIESLIKSKQQVIREIEQYKKSIIYEYVTGKKEV